MVARRGIIPGQRPVVRAARTGPSGRWLPSLSNLTRTRKQQKQPPQFAKRLGLCHFRCSARYGRRYPIFNSLFNVDLRGRQLCSFWEGGQQGPEFLSLVLPCLSPKLHPSAWSTCLLAFCLSHTPPLETPGRPLPPTVQPLSQCAQVPLLFIFPQPGGGITSEELRC